MGYHNLIFTIRHYRDLVEITETRILTVLATLKDLKINKNSPKNLKTF